MPGPFLIWGNPGDGAIYVGGHEDACAWAAERVVELGSEKRIRGQDGRTCNVR
jgi:hypothetical protein